MSEEKWVLMKHPTLPDNDPVATRLSSFVRLHEKKGWEIAEEMFEQKESMADAEVRVFGKKKSPSKKKETSKG